MKNLKFLLMIACVSLLQLSLKAADTTRDACPDGYVKINRKCVRRS